jgi:GDP-D-mannose 3', 5'-epimerase
MMKKAIVCGAGGFIGNHLVIKLKEKGYWVKGLDLVNPMYNESLADEFILGDLRNETFANEAIAGEYDELYQLAADMGGAGYIFTGLNDADIMANSALINLNVLGACKKNKIDKIFFSSSACIYPQGLQTETGDPELKESSAYPADPDSEYGWEKIFAERLYLAHQHNHQMDVKIARYHNVFGPFGVYDGGKEKAISAICRKVSQAKDGDKIEIWGTGKQTRSFLFVDECVEGTLRLMDSQESGPFNIGSDEMVSIEQLTKMIIEISGKDLSIQYIKGPTGVNGRNSHNVLIFEKLGWKPSQPLINGLQITYNWINSQVNAG